jgi:tripartite-type tricarboxylate transporter receptor subunit TctC
MPPDVVRLFSQKLSDAGSSPQFLEQLSKLGSEKTLELTGEFAKSIETERTFWKSIAKGANVQLGE